MFNSSYNDWNVGWRFLFKVTDVKKTQFVTWQLQHVPSPHPDSLDHTTEYTWESYNATRTKMQFEFTHELKTNCLVNHKSHSANPNWSHLIMNLSRKANSCTAYFHTRTLHKSEQCSPRQDIFSWLSGVIWKLRPLAIHTHKHFAPESYIFYSATNYLAVLYGTELSVLKDQRVYKCINFHTFRRKNVPKDVM